MIAIVSLVFLGVFFVVALGFAQGHFHNGETRDAIWWGFAAYVCAGVGVATYALNVMQPAPSQKPPGVDPAAALERLAAQTDAQLRPYMGVSYVKATLEVGKPMSVSMRFTNSGKTPAERVEVLEKLEKLPTGTSINRSYGGKEFQLRSVGDVNVSNTVENEVIGHILTVPELMELTTTDESRLVAHGVIRCHSKYIPGGSDETPFCYEFDKTTGQMVVCKVDAGRR